jgi:UDP-N-acetyl-D-mannosaminuronic acid dehydrogenase
MPQDQLNRFQVLVDRNASIRQVIALMGSSPENKFMAGIAVVVDSAKKVIGVITDGDIRRGISKGVSLEEKVERIANFSPMLIQASHSRAQIRKDLMEEARRRKSHYFKYNKLILVDQDGRLYDVIPLSDVLSPPVEEKVLAIYGMGYVGLTLAATFANAGIPVIGIDVSEPLVAQLNSGTAPFYEKGLDSLLSSLAQSNPIRFTGDARLHPADVHIVTVGSPVRADGMPDLSSVESATRTIAALLKREDLVIFRSTVPVGTMRRIVLPILESSGLECGSDFRLVFAPERTVEGKALDELRSLPQIIGGFDKASSDMAGALFGQITNTIVEVESLEAAELVKLMNNTFRDLVFSFANEVAQICDAYNLNAFSLVHAANEGYPRDRIPLPSPGVGGICLSKDPYIYTHPIDALPKVPVLGVASRSINRTGADYVMGKLKAFCERTGKPLDSLRILILGLAFKGMPETSDIRGSVALDLIEKLPARQNILVKDYVVTETQIKALGCTAVGNDLAGVFSGVDAVVVMNNHYLNNRFNFVQALRRRNGPVLFFDGWNMFDQREIENLPEAYYATMGYMTVSPKPASPR